MPLQNKKYFILINVHGNKYKTKERYCHQNHNIVEKKNSKAESVPYKTEVFLFDFLFKEKNLCILKAIVKNKHG